MSAIAGILTAPDAPPPDAATLEALRLAIAHRGPDGSGHTAVGRVALVHGRLGTTDANTGDQPLFAGSAALVADAAIYNFAELRAAMPGVSFATNGDNEPPLHLWLRDGPDYAGHLRGMYAIAIHERAARTVTLSRDPFGIKPLYVAQTATRLAFASEPQALLAAGIVPRVLRPAARDELLQLQFTTGADTIFQGIRRVLPGETLVCADGRVLERRHLEALPDGGAETIDEPAALTRLDRALSESVDLHRRCEVPCGVILSGGTDSAVLLAMMARLNPAPVLAFSAGFGSGHDTVSAIAKSLGARHHTIEVTEAMTWRHLPEIVACLDDPTADYAAILTWFLARQARSQVKVLLSGEGGDEILAGYGRYRSAMRPWWMAGRVMRPRGAFDRVNVLRSRPAAWRDGIAAAEARLAGRGRTRLMAAQEVDMADWLPNDPLLKLDRCLMAHAIEGRTPFLDRGVAAAAFRLPDALKVRGGAGNWLLRRWLEQHCAAARPFAPKHGFAAPIGEWIGEKGTRLGPLVAAEPGVAEIAEPARVVALFRRTDGRHHGSAAWTLLFYALWHRAHIPGSRAPAGDACSRRARSAGRQPHTAWFLRDCFHRTAGLAPFLEAAADMRDLLQPHVVCRLRRQRRAPAAGAEEHEAFRLREHRLVVWARRVDPELQHAAGAVERAGNAALALQLAGIAQIDEQHAVGAVQLDGIRRRQCLDFGLGLVDHLPEALLNLHLVSFSTESARAPFRSDKPSHGRKTASRTAPAPAISARPAPAAPARPCCGGPCAVPRRPRRAGSRRVAAPQGRTAAPAR